MLLGELERILDERVRPQLALHGGGIVAEDYRDGTLKIRLTGHCSGCPSAALTAQTLVAEELREAAPEVQRIVLLEGVSDSLLAQARGLLSRRHP